MVDPQPEILLGVADALSAEVVSHLNGLRPVRADRPGVVLEIDLVDGGLVWCFDFHTVCRLGDMGHDGCGRARQRFRHAPIDRLLGLRPGPEAWDGEAARRADSDSASQLDNSQLDKPVVSLSWLRDARLLLNLRKETRMSNQSR